MPRREQREDPPGDGELEIDVLHVAQPQLEPRPQPERQLVGRRRPRRRGSGSAIPASGATAPTAVRSSPSTNAPGVEPHVLADPDARELGPVGALGRPHHATALGDDERVGALPDDRDGALGHDRDAQRVRIGAVERDRRDGREARDVHRRRVEVDAEEAVAAAAVERAAHLALRPGRRRPSPRSCGSRRAASRARRGRRAGSRRAPRTRSASERLEGTSRPSSRRSPDAVRGNGTTTLCRPRTLRARCALLVPCLPRDSLLRAAGGFLARGSPAAVAEHDDLLLELDAELLARPAPRLGDQGEAVGRRRAAGVLDEVRVTRRDDRAADAVALQPAELEQRGRRRARPAGS